MSLTSLVLEHGVLCYIFVRKDFRIWGEIANFNDFVLSATFSFSKLATSATDKSLFYFKELFHVYKAATTTASYVRWQRGTAVTAERRTCSNLSDGNSTLSFSQHMQNLTTKAATSLYALKTLKAHGLQRRALWDATHATLVSQITYASPSWRGFIKAEKIVRLTRSPRLTC